MGGSSSKTEAAPPVQTSNRGYTTNNSLSSSHSTAGLSHAPVNTFTFSVNPPLVGLVVGRLDNNQNLVQITSENSGPYSAFMIMDWEKDSIVGISTVIGITKIRGLAPHERPHAEIKYKVVEHELEKVYDAELLDYEAVVVESIARNGLMVVGSSFPVPTYVPSDLDVLPGDVVVGNLLMLDSSIEFKIHCGIPCYIKVEKFFSGLSRRRLLTLRDVTTPAHIDRLYDYKNCPRDIVKARTIYTEYVRAQAPLSPIQVNTSSTTAPSTTVKKGSIQKQAAPAVSRNNSEATSKSNGAVSVDLDIDALIDNYSNLSLKDVQGTLAVVVGRLDGDRRLVQTLPDAGLSQWVILDAKSKNLAIEANNSFFKILADIHTFIKITKMSVLTDGGVHYTHHVDEYVKEESAEEAVGQELVAVVDVMLGAVTVVGNSFVIPTLVPWDRFEKPLQKGDFLIGNAHRLRQFFSPTIMNGVVCYIKDLDAERKWLDQQEKNKKNREAVVARAPDNMFYMTGVRTVFQQEMEKIASNCSKEPSLSLEDAKLYIRDVYIAIARLEKFTRLKSIEEATLQVPGVTKIDSSGTHKRLILTVQLSEEDTNKVVKCKSQDTWRVGSDLSIRHPDLKRLAENSDKVAKEYEGGMTIDRITFDGKRCSVRLRPHPRSYDLFDMVAGSKGKLDGTFTVGPSEEFAETIVETLQSHKFENFVANRELFDSWRGVRRNDTVMIDNLNESFHVNGDTLDHSQTEALRTAIRNPGFTCVEAPPGSGKTFLIAALIGAKYRESGVSGTMCISATTNNAISNAIDKGHDCYPQIRVVREYSKKMEGEIGKKSKEISLRHMAMNAHEHIDLKKHQEVQGAIDRVKACKQGLGKVPNVAAGLKLLDQLQSADYNVRQCFQNAYQPFVIGSTCELIARGGDKAAEKLQKLQEEDTIERKQLEKVVITHLILDEASQLPPHLALAVYISLPCLKQITLIGDTKQLGPYTPLDDKTFSFRMVGSGELERISEVNKKVHLRRVYRSHPRIVDLLLVPIYGRELVSGLTPEKRNLAALKDLPRAEDDHKSPVLFVNIENAKSDKRGVNAKELAVVLGFIEKLRGKGVTGEDVAVVCNHHVQREGLMQALKGKGTIGILSLPVTIHTVDSFQGKEAKVVLLLTTKTAPNPQSAQHIFQFVAHPNRGCVAVSRGQHAIYLFGEWFNLVRTEFWSQFVPGIVEARAMVDSDWKPASNEDYHKLKDGAAQAPKKFHGVPWNRKQGGRGRAHTDPHRGHGPHGRGHSHQNQHPGHITGHLQQPHQGEKNKGRGTGRRGRGTGAKGQQRKPTAPSPP